jgi:DNA-binding MurR/RpiR family transcriptional regulator
MKKTTERTAESTTIAFAVLKEINKNLNDFTPRHRAFAEYVLHNPENLAFLSITEIAVQAGVSQATIVRFCNVLGYDGYAHLVKEARQAIQSEIGSAGRFQIARRMRKKSDRHKTGSIFERLLEQELGNMTNLAKSIKIADFNRCIDLMTEADQICIIGCMSSASIAHFFGDILSRTFHRVDVLDGLTVRASSICQRLTEESLVFLISFPQYTRATEGLGNLAAEKGAHIVAITDNNNSPIVPLGSISFFIPVSIQSYIESYSAPMALISILVNAFNERNPEKTKDSFLRYDNYSSKMNIYRISRAELIEKKPK